MKTVVDMTIRATRIPLALLWVVLAIAWPFHVSRVLAQAETSLIHEELVYPQATAARFLEEDLKAITTPTKRADAGVGLPATIAQTFEKARFDAVVLEGDLAAVRVFGCEAKLAGRFLTIAPAAPTRTDAMHHLALPAENCASHIAELTIPKGTKVFVGHVGGGRATQLFIHDPSVLTVQNISFLQ